MTTRESTARRYYEMNRQIANEVYGRNVPDFDGAVAQLVTAGMPEAEATEWLVTNHTPTFNTETV